MPNPEEDMPSPEDETEIIDGELALAEQLIDEVGKKIAELSEQRDRLVVLAALFTKTLKNLRDNPVQIALAIESGE